MAESIQNFNYEFSAVRGLQAGRAYYVAMCPLGVIPKIFVFDEEPLPADLRAQRVLERSRVPAIATYIVDNPTNYVFSSITASVDGPVEFTASGANAPDVGHLRIPMTARFVINDGQHRRAAIEEALKERPELRTETISVVLFPDEDLERSQQLFADLNKHAVKPTPSIGILYDRRDDMSALTRAVVEQVDVFRGRTEFERSSISYTSRKLFTLSAIHQATAKFLGKTGRSSVEPSDVTRAVSFWQAVAKNMPTWEAVRAGRQHPGEVRRDEIQTHGLALQAIARAGRSLVSEHSDDWESRLKPLQSVDWSRANPQWDGRALQAGVMSKARANVILTSNLLKRELGLPLTDEEQELEDRRAAQ